MGILHSGLPILCQHHTHSNGSHGWEVQQQQHKSTAPPQNNALPENSSTAPCTSDGRKSRSPQRQTRMGAVRGTHHTHQFTTARFLPRTHSSSTVVLGSQSFAPSRSIHFLANHRQPRTITTHECPTSKRSRTQFAAPRSNSSTSRLVNALGSTG